MLTSSMNAGNSSRLARNKIRASIKMKSGHERSKTNHDAAQRQECLVNVGTAFVADSEATELMQPTVGPFDHPAMNSQAAAMSGAAFGQHRLDAALTQFETVRLRVVGSIPLNSLRSSARTPAPSRHGGNRVDQRQQLRDVVSVGSGDARYQRNAAGVREHMVFRALFPAIRGIRTSLVPPKTARTELESITARDQSIFSARCRCSSMTRWIAAHTPRCCQACKRRQQVIPLPHPISCGKCSQGMPVFNTNRIPVSTARLSSGLRPGFRFRRFFGGGKCGSINAHSRSSKIGFAMFGPPCPTRNLAHSINPQKAFC